MGGGVQPHFCPWKKMCLFPFFLMRKNGEKSIRKEREMNTFASLSIYFFPIFPHGENGKRHIFPMGKNGVGPPPPSISLSPSVSISVSYLSLPSFFFISCSLVAVISPYLSLLLSPSFVLFSLSLSLSILSTMSHCPTYGSL